MFDTNNNTSIACACQQDEETYSTNEVSLLLEVDRTTVIRWCQKLPNFAYKNGKLWKIPNSSLSSIIESETWKWKRNPDRQKLLKKQAA